ncbi:MAG: GDSL-type esterase/lipase family protein [Pedobacter sp.]|nr:GDSL-type esterase/lipase family protein [Pedobacter sp.]MDQ8053159.1 GDSL-type esterase/lipase family protein [Pedobacter sp.]
MKKIILPLLLLCLSISTLKAQNKYEKAIVAFEQGDQKNPVDRNNLIVFTGSSAIRKWESLKNDFPGKNVINRGFGGAVVTDLIEFQQRIIAVYQPRQVVIYIGDNDLSTANKGVDQVYLEMVALFKLIRMGSKDTRITVLSIKPSPSRRKLIPQQIELNARLAKFIKSEKNADFVDVFSPMLLPNKDIGSKYYVADSLHLSAEGYKVWKKAISPYLK